MINIFNPVIMVAVLIDIIVLYIAYIIFERMRFNAIRKSVERKSK